MPTDRPLGRTLVATAVASLVWGVLWYGPATQATQVLLLDRPWSWADVLEASTLGTFVGLIGSGLATVLPERDPARRALRDSIEAGRLPAGADAGEWEPRLRRRLRWERVSRWGLAGLFGTEAALLAAVAATVDPAPSTVWAAAATAAVVAVATSFWDVSDRRVLEELLEQVAPPAGARR